MFILSNIRAVATVQLLESYLKTCETKKDNKSYSYNWMTTSTLDTLKFYCFFNYYKATLSKKWVRLFRFIGWIRFATLDGLKKKDILVPLPAKNEKTQPPIYCHEKTKTTTFYNAAPFLAADYAYKHQKCHLVTVKMYVSFCVFILPPERGDLCPRHIGGRWREEQWNPLWRFRVCCSHWWYEGHGKVWLDKRSPGKLF